MPFFIIFRKDRSVPPRFLARSASGPATDEQLETNVEAESAAAREDLVIVERAVGPIVAEA